MEWFFQMLSCSIKLPVTNPYFQQASWPPNRPHNCKLICFMEFNAGIQDKYCFLQTETRSGSYPLHTT